MKKQGLEQLEYKIRKTVEQYASNAQKIRVITETWVNGDVYVVVL